MLLLPPIRFIAIASASCASLLIEPYDMRAGLEPLDDIVHRLYFLDRNRLRFILQIINPRIVAMRSD